MLRVGVRYAGPIDTDHRAIAVIVTAAAHVVRTDTGGAGLALGAIRVSFTPAGFGAKVTGLRVKDVPTEDGFRIPRGPLTRSIGALALAGDNADFIDGQEPIGEDFGRPLRREEGDQQQGADGNGRC